MIDIREEELKALNEFYKAPGFSVAAVYGQRGMGKTTAIRHFASDKEVFYYDALETTGKHQLQMLSAALDINNKGTIEAVLDHLMVRAKTSKLVIVIDSYPNFYRSNPDFDAALASYCINQWKDMDIKLILAGDEFMLMDKYVLGKKARFKDLISLNLKFDKLGFYDSMKFYPDASFTDAAYLYGITGGIPYNLSKVNTNLKESTIRLFLEKNNSVGLGPTDFMSAELRELSYYNHLLTALASGLNRVNQISAEVDKPKDVVVPYLNSLMAIDICTKDTAITEQTNRKKTRYSVVSSSTLFWYKFIAPNYGKYSQGDVEGLYKIVEKDLKEYMQTVFIKICGEYLKKASDDGRLAFTIDQIGNWWVNDDEAGTTEGFDLVALGDSNGKKATIFCQCYYDDEPIDIGKLKVLIDKTKQMDHQGDSYYLVFSKSGFQETVKTASSAIKNIMLIALDDMK